MFTMWTRAWCGTAEHRLRAEAAGSCPDTRTRPAWGRKLAVSKLAASPPSVYSSRTSSSTPSPACISHSLQLRCLWYWVTKHQLRPFRYITKCLGKRSLRLVILLFFSQLFLLTSCSKTCTQLFGGLVSAHSSYHIHSMFSYGHYPSKHAHCYNFPYNNDSEKIIHSSCNHKPLKVYQNNEKISEQ